VLEALDRALPGEQLARRPLVGSHRDRLALRWRGEEIASRASAGERKAIGLLLLAAQASVVERERGAATLLIDDADAELDRDTLHAIWPVLASGLQVVATSNRPEVWEATAPGHRWRVEKGRLCHL
jgi:recombinational DNA repair ATPase RecF